MLWVYAVGPLGVLVGARWVMSRQGRMGVFLWVAASLAASLLWTRGAVEHRQWTALFLLLTNVVAATSAWESITWVTHYPALSIERYYRWWALFWAALLGVALTNNLGGAWLAIELSTLASAALVAEMGTRHALEAAWKYLLIASIGLGLAMVGIVFLYGSLRHLGMGWDTLNYPVLAAHAGAIPVIVREVITVFLVAGLGTKVGLVPFHTWLPDAHSEAPAPVSGLLSGVLLGLCLVVLARWVIAVPLPPSVLWSGHRLLLLFGCCSLVVGSLALLVQRDLKRLLAYSSIEQMGIAAIGFGIGTPLADGAAVAQLLMHGVIKSNLFYVAGRLSVAYGSKRIGRIRAIWTTHRRLAAAWIIGILALAGMPPLGLAFSEWALLDALWVAHQWLVGAVLSGSLVLAFAAVLHHLMSGVWGGEMTALMPRPRRFSRTDRRSGSESVATTAPGGSR